MKKSLILTLFLTTTVQAQKLPPVNQQVMDLTNPPLITIAYAPQRTIDKKFIFVNILQTASGVADAYEATQHFKRHPNFTETAPFLADTTPNAKQLYVGSLALSGAIAVVSYFWKKHRHDDSWMTFPAVATIYHGYAAAFVAGH